MDFLPMGPANVFAWIVCGFCVLTAWFERDDVPRMLGLFFFAGLALMFAMLWGWEISG